MIPTSWKHITIAQFNEANIVLQTKYESSVDQHIKLLEAVSDLTEDEILEMPKDEFLSAVKKLSFLNDIDSISTRFPKRFVLKGKVYAPLQRVDKFTMGQNIDMAHYMKGDHMANLHKLLSTVIMPCDWKLQPKKYNGARIAKQSEIFLHNLTMDIAYPIAVFFCNLLLNLIPNILPYLTQEAQKMMREILSQFTPSLNNTDG